MMGVRMAESWQVPFLLGEYVGSFTLEILQGTSSWCLERSDLELGV